MPPKSYLYDYNQTTAPPDYKPTTEPPNRKPKRQERKAAYATEAVSFLYCPNCVMEGNKQGYLE